MGEEHESWLNGKNACGKSSGKRRIKPISEVTAAGRGWWDNCIF
jgi:hypothetical protein